MPLDLCLVLPSAWPMLLLLIQPWLCIVFHLSDLCYLRSGQFHFGRLSTFHARHCSGVLLQRLKLVSVAHVILGQVLTSQLKGQKWQVTLLCTMQAVVGTTCA